MTPDDVQRIYAAEDAATEEEAAQTRAEAEHNANTARAYLHTVFSLTETDRTFAQLASIALGGILAEMIMERANTDDAFALRAAKHMNRAMDRMAPPERTKRGKPGRPNKMA